MKIEPNANQDLAAQIEAACDQMEQAYAAGRYSKITVARSWSKHNPVISGKIARPSAYRWYLRRELIRLVQAGATIEIAPAQERVDLNSPKLL